MPLRITTALLSMLLTVSAAAAPASPRGPFAGPDGEPLPFADDGEILEFLRSAAVVSSKIIPSGINRPQKLLLESGGVRMHAVFRSVDRREGRYPANDRVILKFHDHHAWEVAAYRLSRMLGIDSVPPAALRRIGIENGSVQVWIEGARTETKRREEGLKSKSGLAWVRQWQVMRVFDALIDNFDRNVGNILVTADWKTWLVDHTRSFTIHRKLDRPERITLCERGLWQRLQTLERAAVEEELGDLLAKPQITALFKRRDLLVKHIEGLIAEKGEELALF